MKEQTIVRLFERRTGEKGVDWSLIPDKTSTENPMEWFLTKKGFSFHRMLALIMGTLNISMVVILLFSVIFGAIEMRTFRSTILSFFLIITFLNYPLGKKSWTSPYNLYTVIDIGLVFLTVLIQAYTLVNIDRFTWKIVEPTSFEIFLGISLFGVVFEAARRTMGLLFGAVCLLFLIQPLFSNYLPGIFYGPPIDFLYLIEQQFSRDDGIFGMALGVMVSTLSVFLIFGTFLQKTSAAQFFISLAFSIAGRFSGGAAKIAVISSGLMGSISGSVVANVVTTGSITIPMMKKSGYEPEFAGGVEAVSSSGGQLMPPIMGIAAFLMAAIMGISYIEVCARALLPAIFYFLAVFLVVHFRARRTGLKPLDRQNIPNLINVLRDGGVLLLPLVVIVYLLLRGYSAEMAVIVSLALIFIVSFLHPETRMNPRKILDAFDESAKVIVPIGVACGAVGMIIGSLGASGLTMRFSSFVVHAAGGKLWIALVYTMVAAIVLGMGVPTAVVYIFLAVIVVPALITMGVEPFAAHLFVFYFGVIGNITPPFALASYAAAGVARTNPMTTAFSSVRVGVASFLIPFMFVYAPSLLFIGPLMNTALVAVPVIIGIGALAGAVEGWFLQKTSVVERLMLLVAAVVLIKPGLLTDGVGLVLVCFVLALQKLRKATIKRL